MTILERIFTGHYSSNPRRGPSPRAQKLVLCAIYALKGARVPLSQFSDMCEMSDDNTRRALRVLREEGWIRGGTDNGYVHASIRFDGGES